MSEAEIGRALAAFAAGETLRGPTVRELQAAMGLSSSNVAHVRFQRLLSAGYIEAIPGGTQVETRRYRLTRAGRARLRTEVLPAYEYALPESGGGW